MRVAPPHLVELASECDACTQELLGRWQEAVAVLGAACMTMGDSPATPTVQETYATAVTTAQDLVNTLGSTLTDAVQAVLATAMEVQGVDDRAAEEMDRTRHQVEGPRQIEFGGKGGDKGNGGGHGGGHGNGGGKGNGGGRG